MKISVQICRWIVGLLFIFSGLIKANDPLGLSYKMLEFFDAWGWHLLDHYALLFSIVMNVFEVTAGLSLLIGWRFQLTIRFLLLLITFFTFLTAYVLFSGKIKECGCFGDCIPLSGNSTFFKDVALLLMIVFILYSGEKIKSHLRKQISFSIVVIGAMLTIGIQSFVLTHLPFIDCLPYKKGNNILNEMKVPAGAVSDSFAIAFKYKKNEKIVEFDKSHFPDDFDSTYEYVDRYQKLVRAGNSVPKIVDFALQTLNGNDSTKEILSQKDKYVLLFVKDFDNVSEWQQQFEEMIKVTKQKNIPVFIVTADASKAAFLFEQITILKCDATVIKTAARVIPTYFIMQEATIIDKFSYADATSHITHLN
jgi:uncharacterized membrane protein YphA (DoxX/SURF4 family)